MARERMLDLDGSGHDEFDPADGLARKRGRGRGQGNGHATRIKTQRGQHEGPDRVESQGIVSARLAAGRRLRRREDAQAPPGRNRDAFRFQRTTRRC